MENWTGVCTQVFEKAPDEHEEIRFERKEVQFKTVFSQGRFKLAQDPKDEDAMETLKTIRDDLAKQKLAKRKPKKQSAFPEENQIERKASYRETMNRKRARILEYFDSSDKVNLTKIARACGACYETVKKLYLHYSEVGEPPQYQYPNLHTKEQQDQLDRSIEGIEAGFATVTDLKRLNPAYSRKKILARLHSTGLRWRKVPRFLKKPPRNKTDSKNVCSIVRLLAAAFYHDDVEVLYVDEMKLPLNQTAGSHWTMRDEPDRTLYGARPIQSTLTAIALCSRTAFVSVVLLQTEVRTMDFVDFLQTSIGRLPNNKQYIILADNATWHKGHQMKKTGVLRFLRFNEPRQFRLNLIENAFSYVRSAYRKRPQQDTIEDEARTILQIFFDPVCSSKFEGFYRNHVRQLILMHEKHAALIEA